MDNLFLENRQQSVKINRTYSGKQTVTSRVSHGSVLGPVLFNNIYKWPSGRNYLYCTLQLNILQTTPNYFVINGQNDETRLQDSIFAYFRYPSIPVFLMRVHDWSIKWQMIFNTIVKLFLWGKMYSLIIL
jgi:hypothetical protein